MTFSRRNILDILLLPIGIVAFAALCWWAIYAGPSSAGKIEARRAADVQRVLSQPDYRWAMASVDGQTVTLTGIAPTTELKNRASRLVLQASGRGGPFWGGVKTVIDETELAPPVEVYRFEAELFNSRVKLTGHVPSINARDRLLERLEKEGFWGDDVVNELEFADGVPEGDWIGAADLGLSQLVRLGKGNVDLTDRRLFLKGEAESSAVRLQVIKRMTQPPSGYTADVDLSGTAIWSAQIEGDRLTLTGAVPDAAIRTELVELSGRFFDGEIINSQIIRPMEDREWVTGVRMALPNFLQFRRGEISYMGQTLIIRGQASQSVIDFLYEDIVRIGTLVDFRLVMEPTSPDLKSLANLTDADSAGPELCREALSEALDLGGISFRYGDEALNRESGEVLDGVEAVLKACPNDVLEVSAFTHIDRQRIAGKQLTEARQRTVSDYFIARGVPLSQIELTDVDFGQSAPQPIRGGEDDSQIRLRFRE